MTVEHTACAEQWKETSCRVIHGQTCLWLLCGSEATSFK